MPTRVELKACTVDCNAHAENAKIIEAYLWAVKKVGEYIPPERFFSSSSNDTTPTTISREITKQIEAQIADKMATATAGSGPSFSLKKQAEKWIIQKQAEGTIEKLFSAVNETLAVLIFGKEVILDSVEVDLDEDALTLYSLYMNDIDENIEPEKLERLRGLDFHEKLSDRTHVVRAILLRLGLFILSFDLSYFVPASSSLFLNILEQFLSKIVNDNLLCDKGMMTKFMERFYDELPKWINRFSEVIAMRNLLNSHRHCFSAAFNAIREVERITSSQIVALFHFLSSTSKAQVIGDYCLEANFVQTQRRCSEAHFIQEFIRSFKEDETRKKNLAIIHSYNGIEAFLGKTTSDEKLRDDFFESIKDLLRAKYSSLEQKDLDNFAEFIRKRYKLLYMAGKVRSLIGAIDQLIDVGSWLFVLSGRLDLKGVQTFFVRLAAYLSSLDKNEELAYIFSLLENPNSLVPQFFSKKEIVEGEPEKEKKKYKPSNQVVREISTRLAKVRAKSFYSAISGFIQSSQMIALFNSPLIFDFFLEYYRERIDTIESNTSVISDIISQLDGNNEKISCISNSTNSSHQLNFMEMNEEMNIEKFENEEEAFFPAVSGSGNKAATSNFFKPTMNINIDAIFNRLISLEAKIDLKVPQDESLLVIEVEKIVSENAQMASNNPHLNLKLDVLSRWHNWKKVNKTEEKDAFSNLIALSGREEYKNLHDEDACKKFISKLIVDKPYYYSTFLPKK